MRPRLAGALLAALLPGCAGQGDAPASTPAQDAVRPPDPRPEQPVELPTSRAAPAVAEDAGIYTSIAASRCTVEELGDELGSTSSTCQGLPPYRLVVTDSDARQGLEVVHGEGPPQSLQLGTRVSGAFSDLGEIVEWRRDAAGAPSALIVRFNAYDQPEKPNRATSFLVVARLADRGSCVVNVLAPGPQQNRQAREAADAAASAPCLPVHWN